MASVDPVPIVATVIDLVRRDPGARGVAIDLQGQSPPIHADAALLKLILQNLLLNAVHAVQGVSSLPIVAVTSYALSGDDARALAAGCDAYVAKPFSPRALLATIRELAP